MLAHFNGCRIFLAALVLLVVLLGDTLKRHLILIGGLVDRLL